MPLEQISNAVIFYAHYVKTGVSVAGLTVTADVWEIQTDGTATEIFSAQAATEIGDGLYRYRVVGADIDAEGEYLCVFKTAGDVDQKHLAAIWVINRAGIENLDAPLTTIDANVDAILVDTGTTLDAALAVVDANVDAILLDTGTDGVVISATVRNAIADSLLSRGVGNVEVTANATSLAALVLAAFESKIAGATWTIYRTDHLTTFTTRTVTTDASAAPVIEVT